MFFLNYKQTNIFLIFLSRYLLILSVELQHQRSFISKSILVKKFFGYMLEKCPSPVRLCPQLYRVFDLVNNHNLLNISFAFANKHNNKFHLLTRLCETCLFQIFKPWLTNLVKSTTATHYSTLPVNIQYTYILLQF